MCAYYGGNEYADDYEDDLGLTQDDMWELVTLFFRSRGLVSQQLKSFDKCIEQQIDEILDDKGSFILKTEQLYQGQNYTGAEEEEESGKTIHIQFNESFLQRPHDEAKQPLTPMQARYRSLTYNLTLLSRITVTVVCSDDSDT